MTHQRWLPASLSRETTLSVFLLPALIINAGNVAAYLFQMVLGHVLSLNEFGSFGALFSAVMILTAPANFLVLTVTKAAIDARHGNAGDQARERSVFEASLSLGGLIGVLLSALGLVILYELGQVERVGTSAIAAALVFVVASCLNLVMVGMVQARRAYIAAALVLGGNPMLRCLIGAGSLLAGAGIAGAMWATALAVALTAVFGGYIVRDVARAGALGGAASVRGLLTRGTGRQALLGTLLTLLANVDVLVARQVLPGDAAGHYAAAAVIGRIPLLLTTAIAGIIFSEAATQTRDGRGKGLLLAIYGTAGVATGCALLIALLARPLLTHLLGARFLPAADALALMSMSMAMLAISQSLVIRAAGRGNERLNGVLALGVLLQTGLPCIGDPSVSSVAWSQLIAQGVVLSGVLLGTATRRGLR